MRFNVDKEDIKCLAIQGAGVLIAVVIAYYGSELKTNRDYQTTNPPYTQSISSYKR